MQRCVDGMTFGMLVWIGHIGCHIYIKQEGHDGPVMLT